MVSVCLPSDALVQYLLSLLGFLLPWAWGISSHHHLEHTKRFTELGREEKGEGGDRGDLVEKKESPKGERAVKPVISLPSEKWVLKIGFLKVQNW